MSDSPDNKISFTGLNGGVGTDLSTTGAMIRKPSFPALLKAPAPAGAPTVSGASAPGSTLSCSQGSWAPDLLSSFLYRAPQGFAFQWSRDGADLPGATVSTVTADTPGNYTCRVTAQNHAGSSSQTSDPHAVIAPVIDNSFELGKLARNTKKGTAALSVTVPGPGILDLSGKNLSSSSTTLDAAATTDVKIKANGIARKKLKRKGKVKITAKITYTPTGGDSATQSESVKLKRKRR
jgi:hypothetical protein